MSLKQRKIKFEPRIKLNHNIINNNNYCNNNKTIKEPTCVYRESKL